MVCLRLCGQKMLRSDFFQILNTYSFYSNEQNIKFSEKMNYGMGKFLAYLFCIAGPKKIEDCSSF